MKYIFQAETFRPVRKQIDVIISTQTKLSINIVERDQIFYNEYNDNVIGNIDRQTDKQIDRQIDRYVNRQTNRQICKQIDKQIDGYIDKQIDKQIDR